LTDREPLVQYVLSVANRLEGIDLSLIDSLVVPASLHDVEGRFLHVNAAAERASGNSNADLLGRHYTALLPPEEREKVEAQFRRAAERGEPTDFESVFIDGSGHQRGVRAQHLPLRSNDEIIGVLILAFEVGRPLSQLDRDPQPRLTPRQREILELIASGASTSVMAKKLTLSTETVRNHVRNVLRELHVHTRLEAIAAARRIGLLSPPALAAAEPGQEEDNEAEPTAT
jgi:PAS domain S-box-containing protein